jgi:ferredoxin
VTAITGNAAAPAAANAYRHLRNQESVSGTPRFIKLFFHIHYIMTFQVSLTQSGRQFSCDADETVLNAALRQGIGLPYGCKNGACGSCKGKLSNGQVEHGPHQQRALSEAEAAQGFTLLCCAKPVSDIAVDVREIAASSDYPIKKLPTRVHKLEKLSDDVMLVSLQLPATENLLTAPVSILNSCCAITNAAATAWRMRRTTVNT